MIDRETTSRILDTANIVDVVSEFVTLRKAGANYKGLCPFHNERTPSFSVSPARNYAHCFSCGKGGSPVGFLMEHEQMTYPEALRWLANKYNIEIRERELTSEELKQENERESMFVINEFLASYYENILQNNPTGLAIGMNYFRGRGFRDDIIRKFRLGFALEDKHALPKIALEKGYKAEFLLKTGHCYTRGNNDYVQQKTITDPMQLTDRFAGRAIFPWISMSGKVVAFGGRKLDAATKGVQQKYVNSPDSPIYHKDHELYGIFQAKRQIAKEDRVFMVEGYTDVISMHQCGIENVVANSGTALSMHQVRMLHRLTNNIVLLYDGDAAGIHAAMRGTDMLLSEGMNVKVLILPDGDDPDSFSRKHSAEEFRDYVEKHQTDFIQFKTDVLLKNVSDPFKRSEAISSIVKSVSVIPDTIVRAAYIQDCSVRLRIGEQILIEQMNKFIRENRDQERKQKEREVMMAANAVKTSVDTSSTSNNLDSELPPDYLPDEAFSNGNNIIIENKEDGRQAAERGSALAQMQRADNLVPKAETTVSIDPTSVEYLLIQYVVRYGNEVLYDNIETEDGKTISLTVAQFIDYEMNSDNLQFEIPILNTILSEASQMCSDPHFNPVHHFTQHTDINISRICSPMIIDRYSLSKTHEYQVTQETKRQQIEHLLLEFKLKYVDKKKKSLLKKMASATSDSDNYIRIMSEYQQIHKIYTLLAKKLGRSL